MARQDEFRHRHPGWQHRDVPFGSSEMERLAARWRAMLDSQNGRDVDDILSGGMTHFVQTIPSLFRPVAPGRALVLGCGTGEEVEELRALGWEAEGITLGPMNIACAAERGLSPRFEDFHTSSLPSAAFDFVVGRQVWEHSWVPFLFAIECARILKPGGTLALETPNARDFTYGGATIHHVFCPTPFQGEQLLRKAGFPDARAYDGSHGERVAFDEADTHRDDVGGGNLVFVGTRWMAPEAEMLHPLVRTMTSERLAAAVDAAAPHEPKRVVAVRALYREILGREGDERGVSHYANSLRTLDEIRTEITNSYEARKRRGET